MGLTPLTLTGVSTYSSDLQKILDKAVQIANIPITQLQNRDSDTLQEKNLLGSLNSTVSTFANSLTSLGDLAASQALTASSSNTSAITATATSSAAPGSYTINSVTSVATAASERTTQSYADSASTPVSSTGTLNLVVGSNNYKFTLTNNSLVGLRDKINSLGAGVNASILTTSAGNYLSISSNTTGATTLQLFDDPSGANTNLLTNTDQGTNAVFQLNGIDVSQPGNVVNSVVPGVIFNIVGPTQNPVTVSLTSDPSQLSSALQNFVNNYNSLQSELNQQVGSNAGLLSGNSVVISLQTQLRQLVSYRSTSGSIHSLADLGIEFSQTGQASLNTDTFNSLSSSQISDAFKFLGSAATGLAGFSQNFNQYTDPVNGLIKAEVDGLTTTDQNLQNQISLLTDRGNAMQTALAQQLAQADTLLSSLQSQQQTITASLTGLNYVLYGKAPNS